MKKRIGKMTSVTLALVIVFNIIHLNIMEAKAITSGGISEANDGVVIAAGSGVYYGKYAHATSLDNITNGASTTGTALTPVLWQVMGEENNNVTLMSKYVIDSMAFFDYNDTYETSWGKVNRWETSRINAYLNNKSFTGNSFGTDGTNGSSSTGATPTDYSTNGFLNSFSLSEKNAIVAPAKLSLDLLASGTNTAISTMPSAISMWLPTATDWDNNEVSWLADSTLTGGKLTGNVAYLKDGTTAVDWWMRSPASRDDESAIVVTSNGTVDAQTTTMAHGIRPIFQLDPKNILFASKITEDASSIQPHLTKADAYYIAGTNDAPNYKVTVVNNNLSLRGLKSRPAVIDANTHPLISVSYGGNIVLAGTGLAGDGYSINYKIVKEESSSRTIVGYGYGVSTGVVTGDEQNITITTLDLNGNALVQGNYTAYVWLQQNNANNANEGSQPLYFTMKVEGGTDTTPPVIASLSPANKAANIAIETTPVISFNEDVTLGTGSIEIYKEGTANAVFSTINASLSVTGNADTYTLHPNADFELNEVYYVKISSASFHDVDNNYFAGILNDGTWRFSTGNAKPAFTITYDGNYGAGIMYPNTVTEGREYTIASNLFFRSGYWFTSWNTMANGTGTSYLHGTRITVDRDIYLYAQWYGNSGGGGDDDDGSDSGGGGGGWRSNAIYAPTKIKMNGKEIDMANIDTNKASYTIEISDRNIADNKAYVMIPANVLTGIRNKNSSFIIDVKTPYGIYKIPVNLTELIPGYADFLKLHNLAEIETGFKISIDNESDDKTITDIVAGYLPYGKIIGPKVNFSIEIVNAKTGIVFEEVTKFSQPIVRYITMPESLAKMPDYYGAFRIDKVQKTADFVPHNAVKEYGTSYVAISSYTNSVYVVAENRVTYSDVAHGEWYKRFIDNSASKGLVSCYGNGDGTFAPERFTTRAEFVQMVVITMSLGNNETANITQYTDISKRDWYYSSIMQARGAGYLDSISVGSSFNPQQSITREEMASILATAVRTRKPYQTITNVNSGVFTDYAQMDPSRVNDISLLYTMNIMVGLGDRQFDPKGLTTRAQSATVQYNLAKMLKMID